MRSLAFVAVMHLVMGGTAWPQSAQPTRRVPDRFRTPDDPGWQRSTRNPSGATGDLLPIPDQRQLPQRNSTATSRTIAPAQYQSANWPAQAGESAPQQSTTPPYTAPGSDDDTFPQDHPPQYIPPTSADSRPGTPVPEPGQPGGQPEPGDTAFPGQPGDTAFPARQPGPPPGDTAFRSDTQPGGTAFPSRQSGQAGDTALPSGSSWDNLGDAGDSPLYAPPLANSPAPAAMPAATDLDRTRSQHTGPLPPIPSGADPAVGGAANPATDHRTYPLSMLLLFASIGLNIYLSWIAVDTYNRYQDLVNDMRTTRARREHSASDRYADESIEASTY